MVALRWAGHIRARCREGWRVLRVNHGEARCCDQHMRGPTSQRVSQDRSSKLVVQIQISGGFSPGTSGYDPLLSYS